jgi:hypothetical protein
MKRSGLKVLAKEKFNITMKYWNGCMSFPIENVKCPVLNCNSQNINVKCPTTGIKPKMVECLCVDCETVFRYYLTSIQSINNVGLFRERIGVKLAPYIISSQMFCDKISTILDLFHSNGLFGLEDPTDYFNNCDIIAHTRANLYLTCNFIAEMYEFIASDTSPLKQILDAIHTNENLNILKNDTSYIALKDWQKHILKHQDDYKFIRTEIAFHQCSNINHIDKMLSDIANADNECDMYMTSGIRHNNSQYIVIRSMIDYHFGDDTLKKLNDMIEESRNAFDMVSHFNTLLESIYKLKNVNECFDERLHYESQIIEVGAKVKINENILNTHRSIH